MSIILCLWLWSYSAYYYDHIVPIMIIMLGRIYIIWSYKIVQNRTQITEKRSSWSTVSFRFFSILFLFVLIFMIFLIFHIFSYFYDFTVFLSLLCIWLYNAYDYAYMYLWYDHMSIILLYHMIIYDYAYMYLRLCLYVPMIISYILCLI